MSMTGWDLIRILESGRQPVATFHDPFEDFESCIDNHMRGRIVGFRQRNEDCFEIYVDLNDFEEHNRPYEKRNYWNPRAPHEERPSMNARESGNYPKDGIETVYLGYEDDYSTYFTLDAKDSRYAASMCITDVRVSQTGGRDVITIWTTLPNPFPGSEDQSMPLTFEVPAGTGKRYLRENFNIDLDAEVASKLFG